MNKKFIIIIILLNSNLLTENINNNLNTNIYLNQSSSGSNPNTTEEISNISLNDIIGNSKRIITKEEINNQFLIKKYIMDNFHNPVFINDKNHLKFGFNEKNHFIDNYKTRISSHVFWYFFLFNMVWNSIFFFIYLLFFNFYKKQNMNQHQESSYRKQFFKILLIFFNLIFLLFDVIIFFGFFAILKLILIRNKNHLKYYLIYYDILKPQFQLYWRSFNSNIFFWIISILKIIGLWFVFFSIKNKFETNAITEDEQYLLLLFFFSFTIPIITHFFQTTKNIPIIKSYFIKEDEYYTTYYTITKEGLDFFQKIYDKHQEILEVKDKHFLIYEKKPNSYDKEMILKPYKYYENIKNIRTRYDYSENLKKN